MALPLSSPLTAYLFDLCQTSPKACRRQSSHPRPHFLMLNPVLRSLRPENSSFWNEPKTSSNRSYYYPGVLSNITVDRGSPNKQTISTCLVSDWSCCENIGIFWGGGGNCADRLTSFRILLEKPKYL
ncbi:hypothetical protein BDN70DRAFT_885713 [Pholiota conissans]|uniref:Uncharacterized protein n=1 Tax=Pholiota conissans TaxID=109636 RepID=A0A9P5YPJ8_9AGAR|nr:hypothetical protein BDN70DRAFT_885713 [Pholiota conissans]